MKQKRTQLNYQDVTPCHDEVVNKWRSLLGKVKSAADPDHKVIPKVDLWALVKDGRFMSIISVGFLILLWLLCVNHSLISLLRTPRTPTINKDTRWPCQFHWLIVSYTLRLLQLMHLLLFWNNFVFFVSMTTTSISKVFCFLLVMFRDFDHWLRSKYPGIALFLTPWRCFLSVQLIWLSPSFCSLTFIRSFQLERNG